MAGLNTITWGERGDSAIVLLHGFMGSAHDWATVAPSLAGHHYILAPDLPGHGASLARPASEYTLQGAADAVIQTAMHRGVERLVVAGYSMGGRVAMHLADRAQSLVLFSAHPGLPQSKQRKKRQAIDAMRAEAIQRDFEGFLRGWLQGPLFGTLSTETRQRLVKNRLARCNPSELARALEGLSLSQQEYQVPGLQSLQVAVRVAVGSLDSKYSELAQTLAHQAENVTITTIQGAGHNLIAEAPAQVGTVLRETAPRNRPTAIR